MLGGGSEEDYHKILPLLQHQKNVTRKKVYFSAGHLEELPFDTYIALPVEERKIPVLLECFDYAKQNRKVVIEDHQRELADLTAEVFPHKLLELIIYAYPKFSDDAINQ